MLLPFDLRHVLLLRDCSASSARDWCGSTSSWRQNEVSACSYSNFVRPRRGMFAAAKGPTAPSALVAQARMGRPPCRAPPGTALVRTSILRGDRRTTGPRGAAPSCRAWPAAWYTEVGADPLESGASTGAGRRLAVASASRRPPRSARGSCSLFPQAMRHRAVAVGSAFCTITVHPP
jgi:hypothetical protein